MNDIVKDILNKANRAVQRNDQMELVINSSMTSLFLLALRENAKVVSHFSDETESKREHSLWTIANMVSVSVIEILGEHAPDVAQTLSNQFAKALGERGQLNMVKGVVIKKP